MRFMRVVNITVAILVQNCLRFVQYFCSHVETHGSVVIQTGVVHSVFIELAFPH